MSVLKPPNYYLFYFSIHKSKLFSFQFDWNESSWLSKFASETQKNNYSLSSNEHPSENIWIMQTNHLLGNSYRSFYDTSLKHDSVTLHLHTLTLLTHLIIQTFALSMVLSSFPHSLIPPSIFSSFLLLTTKCSLSFEISNAAILWGKCIWEDRNGYTTWFTKFLVKPVITLMVSAERVRSSHLSLGHPWHPQVAPIQAWQGEQR